MHPESIPIAAEKAPADARATATSVRTAMVFDAARASVWERLMFYEQIDERPPLHLRMLLPVPIETVGRKSEVGDEARCNYEGGHLVKRVTEIEARVRYAFDVIEQELVIGGGMRLFGGEYVLRDLADGRTEVTVATRYTSAKRPRWLWEPVERAVCHSFHRHILRAMRRGIGASNATP
jgi:hypothetical protein